MAPREETSERCILLTDSPVQGVLSEVPGWPLRDRLSDPKKLSEPLRPETLRTSQACCPFSCCPLIFSRFFESPSGHGCPHQKSCMLAVENLVQLVLRAPALKIENFGKKWIGCKLLSLFFSLAFCQRNAFLITAGRAEGIFGFKGKQLVVRRGIPFCFQLCNAIISPNAKSISV